MGVDDCAPHELETALLEVAAEGIGLFARGGELAHSLPFVDLRLAANEAPDVFVERAEFFLYFQKGAGIGDRSVHFEAIPDDAGIEEQLLYPLLGKPGDLLGIELGERLAIGLAFAVDGDPTQPCLGTFEREKLELLAVVVDRNAPFLVVIGDQFTAARVLPIARLFRSRHHAFTR